MQITFQSILKIYITVLMALSLLYITDRLVQKSSQPVIVDDQLGSVVLVLKKGCIFPQHWEKL